MGRALHLRDYTPRDADAVWAVHESALRASPLAFVEEAAVDEDLTAVEDHYLDAGGEFLVGVIDDRDGAGPDSGSVVAIGGFLPVDESTVEVERMRVDPDHQREGYASAVLGELEARARSAGFDTAVLETVEPLRAARAFYEDAGYAVVETWTDSATGVQRYRYRTQLE